VCRSFLPDVALSEYLVISTSDTLKLENDHTTNASMWPSDHTLCLEPEQRKSPRHLPVDERRSGCNPPARNVADASTGHIEQNCTSQHTTKSPPRKITLHLHTMTWHVVSEL
jgi:hypothetical protein